MEECQQITIIQDQNFISLAAEYSWCKNNRKRLCSAALLTQPSCPHICFLSGKWDVLDDFPASIWRGSLQVFHHPAPANLHLRETPATKGDAHSLLCICSYQNKWAILDGKITYIFRVTSLSTKMHTPWFFMYIAYDQNYESGILPSKPVLIIVSKERVTIRPHVWALFRYTILIIFAGYKPFSHLLIHFHVEHLSQKLAFYI